jgi:uncharacterized protein YggL (DUF469 family)
MQMFFSFNTRALEQPNRHHGPWIEEMQDDYEVIKGTALLSLWQPDEDIMAVQEQEKEVEAVLEVEDGEIMVEEEEEEEEKKEVQDNNSEEDRLEEFIKDYVEKHNCTKQYRFGGHKSQQLEGLLIAAKLKDTGKEVEKKIRKWCGEKEKAAVVTNATADEE